jgi:hypothetical protein
LPRWEINGEGVQEVLEFRRCCLVVAKLEPIGKLEQIENENDDDDEEDWPASRHATGGENDSIASPPGTYS